MHTTHALGLADVMFTAEIERLLRASNLARRQGEKKEAEEYGEILEQYTEARTKIRQLQALSIRIEETAKRMGL